MTDITSGQPGTRSSSKACEINRGRPGFFQKILGAPLLLDGKVIGVIQGSRRGGTSEGVGPNFTAEHLANLPSPGKRLGKRVDRAAGE